MSELFSSGHLIDLILLLVALQTAGLLLYWRRSGRGIAPADLLPNIIAGACLLLAMRLALGGAGWMASCASLAVAGLAHLADLRRRWR